MWYAKHLYLPSAPQRVKPCRHEELWWQHSPGVGRSMRGSCEPPWWLLPFLLPVSSWFAVSHRPLQFIWLLSSAGLGRQQAQPGELVRAAGEGGHTVPSYCDLLSYFSFSQPLLPGKISCRSWQVQEVRQKLWAEPSMGRSLNPKSALGGSDNRV